MSKVSTKHIVFRKSQDLRRDWSSSSEVNGYSSSSEVESRDRKDFSSSFVLSAIILKSVGWLGAFLLISS